MIVSQLKHETFCHKTDKKRVDVYIYRHPQTDVFVVSQLFSVARHVGRFKAEIETRPPLC